jgi:hypothetical protein
VLILALVLIAAARSQRKMRLSHWLVVLLTAWAGVYAVRNLPVSAMLLALIMGPSLWESVAAVGERPAAWGPVRKGAAWLSEFAARIGTQESQFRGHLWPALGVIAALTICLNGGRLGSQRLIHNEFDADHFPAGAVEYLLQERSTEPIFGPDQWGGYLIYSLYPQRLVQIDDRHDLYGSERFREYLILMQGEPGWKDVLEKWRIRTLVLSNDSTLANLLAQLPREWQKVYEDKSAVVVERKDQ